MTRDEKILFLKRLEAGTASVDDLKPAPVQIEPGYTAGDLYACLRYLATLPDFQSKWEDCYFPGQILNVGGQDFNYCFRIYKMMGGQLPCPDPFVEMDKLIELLPGYNDTTRSNYLNDCQLHLVIETVGMLNELRANNEFHLLDQYRKTDLQE